MIEINVLFLGPARDFAGVENKMIELADDTTLAELSTILAERHPGLAGAMSTIRFAVNQEFADHATTLSAGDEVALIPPVSGGTEPDEPSVGNGVLVELVRDSIPVDIVREFVTGDTALGGIATFEGVTRGETDPLHGPLSHLDYEAYEKMALGKLGELARQAKERWSAGRVAIVHRLGKVKPGEASVVIAVACAHRAEAFDACRWLIDTLKKEVPIWKKNVYAGGFTKWVNVGT